MFTSGLIDANFFLFLRIGLTEPVSLESAAIRVLVITIFIAVVGLGTAIWLRKRKVGSAFDPKKNVVSALLGNRLSKKNHEEIILTSTHRIIAGQSLVSVRWKGKAILLGCTNHTITVLSEQTEDQGALGDGSR